MWCCSRFLLWLAITLSKKKYHDFFCPKTKSTWFCTPDTHNHTPKEIHSYYVKLYMTVLYLVETSKQQCQDFQEKFLGRFICLPCGSISDQRKKTNQYMLKKSSLWSLFLCSNPAMYIRF